MRTLEFILSNPLILLMGKLRQRETIWASELAGAEQNLHPPDSWSIGLLATSVFPLHPSVCPLHCHASHQSRPIKKLHHLVLQTVWGLAQYPCVHRQMELLYTGRNRNWFGIHFLPDKKKVSFFCCWFHVDKIPK